MHEAMSVMVAKLLTAKRRSKRFSRYRAAQRDMHDMASTAAYGDKLVPRKDLRLISERGSNKTMP